MVCIAKVKRASLLLLRYITIELSIVQQFIRHGLFVERNGTVNFTIAVIVVVVVRSLTTHIVNNNGCINIIVHDSLMLIFDYR